MAMRINKDDIAEHLGDAGHNPSEWDGIDQTWQPGGYRTAQDGIRRVLVFHDGHGEEHYLGLYELALRNHGYHTHATQQPGGGRRRLEVTRP